MGGDKYKQRESGERPTITPGTEAGGEGSRDRGTLSFPMERRRAPTGDRKCVAGTSWQAQKGAIRLRKKNLLHIIDDHLDIPIQTFARLLLSTSAEPEALSKQ